VSDLALDYSLPAEVNHEIRGWGQRFLMIGGAAAAACVVGAFLSPAQFLHSYLWSYMFFIGVTLGSMALNMLQFLTGGAWGIVIRRFCEAASRTLPLLAILFLPIVIGIPTLYEWSNAAVVARDEVLRHKHAYLNVPFFLMRAAIYFLGWMVLSHLLNKWSREQDETGSRALNRRLQLISGPGLIWWGLSVTFMSIDWILSLNPHWFSTIFGLLFMAGQGLNAMAFLITLAAPSARPGQADAGHGHGLGVFFLLPVFDHLVRQPGGGNPVVRGAPAWRLAIYRAGPGVSAFRVAVRAAALARGEAQHAVNPGSFSGHHHHAFCGSLLAGDA
jgi:hypothetical protein